MPDRLNNKNRDLKNNIVNICKHMKFLFQKNFQLVAKMVIQIKIKYSLLKESIQAIRAWTILQKYLLSWYHRLHLHKVLWIKIKDMNLLISMIRIQAICLMKILKDKELIQQKPWTVFLKNREYFLIFYKILILIVKN